MHRKLAFMLSLATMIVMAASPVVAGQAKEISGTVASFNLESYQLVLKLDDGSEATLNLRADTPIVDARGNAKTMADLASGTKVKATSSNDGGTWTASRVVLQ